MDDATLSKSLEEINDLNFTDPIALCKAFVRLEKVKKLRKDDVEKIDEKLELLDEKISNLFIQKNIRNMSVDGRTVYRHSQLWAYPKSGVDIDKFIEALHNEGIGDCAKMKVNTSSLSACYRDWVDNYEDDQEPPPPYPALDDFVDVQTKYKIKTSKSRK